MANITYPQVNGFRYSYASIVASIQLPNGQAETFIGFKSINYSDNQKKGQVYGTSSLPVGRTRGKYEAKADLEAYLLEGQALLDALGQGFGSVPITLIVQFAENDDNDVTTHKIIGAMIESVSISNSESTDASSMKFELSVIVPIQFNKVSLAKPLSPG